MQKNNMNKIEKTLLVSINDFIKDRQILDKGMVEKEIIVFLQKNYTTNF